MNTGKYLLSTGCVSNLLIKIMLPDQSKTRENHNSQLGVFSYVCNLLVKRRDLVGAVFEFLENMETHCLPFGIFL
jgi:hypothetical protein